MPPKPSPSSRAAKRSTAAPSPPVPKGDFPPSRVVIEGVSPEIDGGAFPIKRVSGESVRVEADLFADGHEVLDGSLLFRRAGEKAWREVPLEPLGNDRWAASFRVEEIGTFEYTLEGWIDPWGGFRRDLAKKHEAGQTVDLELEEGALLLEEAAQRAAGEDRGVLAEAAVVLRNSRSEVAVRVAAALAENLVLLLRRHGHRVSLARYAKVLRVLVEPPVARTGAWYEFFPRSCSPKLGRHGTLRDAEARLEYAAKMGFDVVYLPPIHPIGRSFRKGPNNVLECGPGDPGSPWAVGGPEGGHTAVHPELGTLADFDRFVRKADSLGLKVALDVAFQCSPDHPWVREHPDWFLRRPDGSIRYAENPPKKYQDIYPLNFECADWRALYAALRDVFLFWAKHGVTIFRVDNPHTKPFRFWEWCLAEVRRRVPEAVFLSEAFTRPKILKYLAKAGFSQSYTYFTWRNAKWEIEQYFTELTRTEVREYLRPNLFVNTPDILPEYLQTGGRPAFQIRLVLAATLGASYGVYGPPFELCVGEAHGKSEEYLDSEKYQIRHWDVDAPHSLRDYVTRVNWIRRENPALHTDHTLAFHPVDNDQITAYTKSDPETGNLVLTVVNLDPRWTQSGWVRLPPADLGLPDGEPFQVHDLLSDQRYLWKGEVHYVKLDPAVGPAHIFRIPRGVGTQRDFKNLA